MLVVHMWQVAGVIYISTDTLDNSLADTLAGSDSLSFSTNVTPMVTQLVLTFHFTTVPELR